MYFALKMIDLEDDIKEITKQITKQITKHIKDIITQTRQTNNKHMKEHKT